LAHPAGNRATTHAFSGSSPVGGNEAPVNFAPRQRGCPVFAHWPFHTTHGFHGGRKTGDDLRPASAERYGEGNSEFAALPRRLGPSRPCRWFEHWIKNPSPTGATLLDGSLPTPEAGVAHPGAGHTPPAWACSRSVPARVRLGRNTTSSALHASHAGRSSFAQPAAVQWAAIGAATQPSLTTNSTLT